MYMNLKAFIVGILCSFSVVAVIFIGSLGLTHFDHALVWYALITILTAYAVGYRFSIWIQRPPTKMYFTRGLQILFKRKNTSVKNIDKPFWELTKIILTKFLAQKFIKERSRYRWIMHFFLAGGTLLSFAVVLRFFFAFFF